MRHAATFAMLVLAALAGCMPAAQSNTPGITVRDSAGITLVEHSAEVMATLPRWTIDEIPLELIAGEPDSGFTEIGNVLRLSNGRYLIGDRSRRDLRLYTVGMPGGQVLARNGRGPGEVVYVNALQRLRGDSLGYADGNLRRYAVVTPEGRFAYQVNYPRFDDGRLLRLVARLDDGRLLGLVPAPLTAESAQSDSVRRLPLALVAATVAGDSAARVDTLAVVPDMESYYHTTTERGQTRPDEYPLRFGRRTAAASNGTRIVLTTNQGLEIREYAGGRLMRWIRAAEPARPVTPADRDRLLQESEAMVNAAPLPAAQKEDLRRMREAWRFATHFAHIERLFLGDDGTVWGEAPVVNARDARRYIVFDSTGRALARVQMPSSVVVQQATANEVVGITFDEDDVPQVARWRLRVQP